MVQTISTGSSARPFTGSKSDTIRIFAADHPVVRHGIAAAVQQEPDMKMVGEAGDGRQAIDEVKRLRPDVVITDIELPSLSGIEVTRRITEAIADVAVIIFTSCPREDRMLKALQAGARGYILKTIEVHEILSAIRTVHSGEVCISPSMASKLVGNYVSRSSKSADRYYWLSEREREVLPLVAQGQSHEDIGKLLQLSPYTIQTYRQRIMRKLDLHSEAEILKYALSRGLVSLDA